MSTNGWEADRKLGFHGNGSLELFGSFLRLLGHTYAPPAVCWCWNLWPSFVEGPMVSACSLPEIKSLPPVLYSLTDLVGQKEWNSPVFEGFHWSLLTELEQGQGVPGVS